jgi:hypothetical protein
VRHVSHYAICEARGKERVGYVVGAVEQEVADTAVIQGRGNFGSGPARPGPARRLVLDMEDACTMAPRQGFAHGAICPQYCVGTQA